MQNFQSKPIIVIPAFNEEKLIGNTIALIRKTGIQARIIIVDDGSTDKTARIAEQVGCQVLRMEKNFGKTNTVYAGIKAALRQKPTSIVLLDADVLAIPEHGLENLIRPADYASFKKMIEMAVAPWHEPNGSHGTSLSGIRAFSIPAASKLMSSKFKSLPKGYGLEIFLNSFFMRKTLTEDIFRGRQAMKNPKAKTQPADLLRMLGKVDKLKKHWRQTRI